MTNADASLQEEQHRADDVVDLGDAPERDALDELPVDLRIGEPVGTPCGVRTTVGATPFTLMPCRASSTACCRTSSARPPLLLQYDE